MRVALLLSTFGFLLLRAARAQSCPKENPDGPSTISAPRSIAGRIVYHKELRDWFGLQLDVPVCGLKEIQLVQLGDSASPPVEVFRGCRATVTGALDIPGTGYFSTKIFQNVTKIEPASDCVPQAPFPDYSRIKPPRSLRSYRVSMTVDYAQQGPILVNVRSGSRVLTPWQVYAHHFLTGGFGLYAYCADDFVASQIVGTPEAKPWALDGYVALDPESAAEKGVKTVRVAFTCKR